MVDSIENVQNMYTDIKVQKIVLTNWKSTVKHIFILTVRTTNCIAFFTMTVYHPIKSCTIP